MLRAYPAAICLALLLALPATAEVVAYEGESIPEEVGWSRSTDCTPERTIASGWVHQELAVDCVTFGDSDTYVRQIPEFLGETTFFVEWRVFADGDNSEIPLGGPSALALGTSGPVNYTFFVSRDLAKLNRDNLLPIVFVDLAPGVHTHRLELYGDELYIWYIDGVDVDSGIPEGPFPSFHPSVTWHVRSIRSASDVYWDYIRFGPIPIEGSGDFDSCCGISLRDFRYFQECQDLSGPGVDAGPGCTWADFDDDHDVDLADFAEFQVRFTGEQD